MHSLRTSVLSGQSPRLLIALVLPTLFLLFWQATHSAPNGTLEFIPAALQAPTSTPAPTPVLSGASAPAEVPEADTLLLFGGGLGGLLTWAGWQWRRARSGRTG